MASNAPVSGSVVETAEKAENSELAQKLPARLSGEVQTILAEVFRLAFSTPSQVADISALWKSSTDTLLVGVWLGGSGSDDRSPDFERELVLGSPFDDLNAADTLNELSAFVAGAWILAGSKGGAL